MVYFAQEGDGGLIKIGCSSNVEGRIRALRRQLTVLACVPGMYKTERFIHRRFAHLKVAGEWFRPGSELLDFIARPEMPRFDERERLAKTAFLAMRVNREERAEWSSRAAALGLPLAAWMRMILIEAAYAQDQKTGKTKAGN